MNADQRQGPVPQNLEALTSAMAQQLNRSATLAAWGVVAQVANTMAVTCRCDICRHVSGRLVDAVCRAMDWKAELKSPLEKP